MFLERETRERNKQEREEERERMRERRRRRRERKGRIGLFEVRGERVARTSLYIRGGSIVVIVLCLLFELIFVIVSKVGPLKIKERKAKIDVEI